MRLRILKYINLGIDFFQLYEIYIKIVTCTLHSQNAFMTICPAMLSRFT
jgi:hypothetical protein